MRTYADEENAIDEAAEMLIAAERVVIPEEAITRYVDTRIPPLVETIDGRRRELCRDLVVEAAGDGLSTQATMELLVAQGFGRSDWHRETIARTESSQLYNHGRIARYRSAPGVAGYRYEAIMDGRTSEICEELNGTFIKFDDADGATPPLHFACRSTISPVMWWEVPDEWGDAAGIVGEHQDPRMENAYAFGTIDMTDMPPEATFEDFARPLTDSEQEELRAIGDAIVAWKARTLLAA